MSLNPQEVHITGLSIGFWDMVIFFVTALLAVIPALLIFAVLVGAGYLLFMAVV